MRKPLQSPSKSLGSVRPGRILSISTNLQGVPVATVSLADGGLYRGVRFLDLGGGSEKRFSHAPSGLSTLQATEEAINQGDAPEILVAFGPGRLPMPYVLGALRSSSTSTSFTSDEDTATSPDQAPSSRIHAAKDRAEGWQGARWVIRDDGTFELDTSESGRPVKMVVGENNALRLSHARRDNEGNIVETHSTTERVFLAVTVLAWINSTLISQINSLSAQVAEITAKLNVVPGSVTPFIPTPIVPLDDSVLSAAIQQSTKSVKEEV